jgi:GST-like protein
MPDGTVMSESAAITLLLADVTGQDSLVPRAGAPERAAFLRWLVFLVANLYPTFTYGDIPGRFVPMEAAQAGFLATVEAYRERLWRQVEGEVKGPWFLGGRFSALDLYLGIMTMWGPRRPWFAAHTPRIAAAVARAEAQPLLADFWTRNPPP